MKEPLISCIMPTANRRYFMERSLMYFARQTYPNRELIIVDDGDDSVDDIVVGKPGVVYTLMAKRGATIGEKRNRACDIARGEFICHWDDDDWQHPRRLELQLATLRQLSGEICGQDKLLYFDITHQRAWRYEYPLATARTPWVAGNTFFYWKEYWSRRPFKEIMRAEDTRFLWDELVKPRITVHDPTLVVGIMHPNNVAPKMPERFPRMWQETSIATFRETIGQDADWYLRP
jgi:glycosyltransferase involved in cell wall biosynthesis